MTERWRDLRPAFVLVVAAAWFAAGLVGLRLFGARDDVDARAMLLDDLARGETARGTVSYAYSSEPSSLELGMRAVWRADGAGSMRIDVVAAGGESEVRSFIVVADRVFDCAGPPGTAPACRALEVPGQDATAVSRLPFFAPVVIDSFRAGAFDEVDVTLGRDVTGVAVSCYGFGSAELPEQRAAALCFDDEGRVLSGTVNGSGGEVRFEALTADDGFDSNAFEPSYVVEDLTP